MAEHHTHGEMDVREHEKTFEGFVRFVAWGAVASIAVLIFLALVGA